MFGTLIAAAVLVAGLGAATEAETTPGSRQRVLEIRSYRLKPGGRVAFHERFVWESLPLLRQRGIDVVAYGPSLHDSDSYYLMRAFATVAERERTEEAFYASPEWREGPREAVMAAIESYTTIVVAVDEETLGGLRNMQSKDAAADIQGLAQLNADYIASVKASDVGRFQELLGDDFLCSLPDGTLIDRARFLELASTPYPNRALEAHDVQIRLLGDVAIVHARTTFQLPEGRAATGRYTDVWARRNGRWVAVAAHFTRN